MHNDDERYEPPDTAIATAIAFFQPTRHKLASIGRIVADVVYDSLTDPLPVGVRQSNTTIRHAVFTAPGFDLNVSVQPVDNERAVVIGQVNAASIPVEVRREAEAVKASMTNEWGEFLFELPRGTYQLEFCTADQVLVVPPIQIEPLENIQS